MHLYSLPLLISLIFCLSCAEKKTSQISSSSFIEKELTTVFRFSESDSVFFRRISDLKMNRHGNILVRDFYQKSLFVFDDSGNFRQKIGREGAGPGEFGLIGGFILNKENNELIVLDRAYFKIETFALKGDKYEHKTSYKLKEAEDYGYPLSIIGTEIILQKFPTFYGQSLEHKNDFIFSLITKTGEVKDDTLFTFKGNDALIKDSGELLSANKPQGIKSYFTSNFEDEIYAVRSDSLTVHKFNIEGKKSLLFSHSLTPKPIPLSFKDSLLNTLDNPHKAEARKQFPNFFPMVTGIVADNGERIWLELNSDSLRKGWFVFSRNGEPLFFFQKPNNSATLHSIKNNKVMWSYLNEENAPTFVISTFEL